MGYRSSGTFVMMREAYDRAVTLDMLGTFPELIREITPEILKDYVYWEYDGYKMYSGYPDVDEFTNWMELFDTDDEDGLPWLVGFEQPYWRTNEMEPVPPSDVFQYIRVGEEAGDVEFKGNLGILSVRTEIVRE